MKFKSIVLPAVAALVSSVFLANSSSAASIGIQFVETGMTGRALGSTETAGYSQVAQDNWNVITADSVDRRTNPFSAYNLIDDSGNATTLSMTAYGFLYGGGPDFSTSAPNAAGNNKLKSDQLLSFEGADASIAVSNIAFSLYDVYVYVACDSSSRTGTLTLGGTSITYLTSRVGDNGTSTTDWTTNPNSTTLGSTYIVFSGVSGSSFTLTDNVPGNGGINGIQIRAVPEPSTWAMLGLASVGFVILRRWKPFRVS